MRGILPLVILLAVAASGCFGTSPPTDLEELRGMIPKEAPPLALPPLYSTPPSLSEIPKEFLPELSGPLRQITMGHGGDDNYPAVSPDGKWLAFSSTRHTEKSHLYVIDISERNKLPEQVSFSSHSEIQPCWSPDGRKIAFATNKNGPYDIVIIDRDNAHDSRQFVLTGDLDSHKISPAWHPTWNMIAFNKYNQTTQTWDVWMRDASGSRTSTYFLLNNALYPKWSPDGKKLLFQRPSGHKPYFYSIWTVELFRTLNDHGDPSFGTRRMAEVVSSQDWAAINGTWSPDGKHIAFATVYRSPEMKADPKNLFVGDDIWYINENGNGQVRLTTDPAAEWAPVWAPALKDGVMDKEHPNGPIYFCSKRDVRGYIWMMSPGYIDSEKEIPNTNITTSDKAKDIIRENAERPSPMEEDKGGAGEKKEPKPPVPDGGPAAEKPSEGKAMP
jgi:Tol biopolymer transport system component